MTDETPKPKRKRWRWIIAGVLLFVLAVCWYWPRGDARFVAKWRVNGSPRMTWTFHQSGLCTFDNHNGTWATTAWRTEDGVLVLGASRRSWWYDTAVQIEKKGKQKGGIASHVEFGSVRYPITHVSRDTIRLSDVFGAPDYMVLTRIPK